MLGDGAWVSVKVGTGRTLHRPTRSSCGPLGRDPGRRRKSRPAPARPLHAQLSLSAEEALGTTGAAEDAPKGDGLRHAGLGVSLSFARSRSLAPAPQSRQAQLNPQKGSSVSPMGTLALAAPLSTASGRAWAAVFCPLPAPGSSFSFTPLTRPPQPQRLSGRSRAEIRTQSPEPTWGAVWVSSPLTWKTVTVMPAQQPGSQWVLRSPAPNSQGCGPG